MKIFMMLFSMMLILVSCAHTEPEYVLPTARISDYESDESGLSSKSLFYDNGHEVVVFDAQFSPELAEKAVAYIASQTPHPIKYVVITHPGAEKFNGLEVFKRMGAKIIASQATAASMGEVHQYKKKYYTKVVKSFTEDSYPSLVKPDITFDKRYFLKLSHGETLELLELSRSAASSNQTIVHIPRIEALVVGDLAQYKSHVWLEGGIYQGIAVAKLQNWIADLNELNTLFAEKNVTVYGSRGGSGTLDQVVDSQVDYLEKVDTLVTDYVKGLSVRGLKKKELSSPEIASKHYKELQKRIEALFPGYKNSYLIGDSIYGLVNTK